MTAWSIDPDVTRARTLDARFYTSAEAWALARERIFARSWCWIGDLADVAEPGTLAPRWLHPGLIDEPLLLARDRAGVLHCLSNVCTHRGNLLVQRAGRADEIRCGYHSRRFGLDGRMRFMPGFEGACDFPGERDHLPSPPFGTWHGHGFASLAGHGAPVPLPASLSAIDARLGPRLAEAIESWPHDPARDRTFEFDAHWALYIENYLEGLHIPFVHPGLSRTLDMSDYRYELHPGCNLQLGLAREGEAAFERSAGGPDAGGRIAAYYFWVWPNLMLNFYPWGLSVNQVQPLAPARTRVIFRSYVADPSRLAQGAGGALDPVEMEDEAVVLTVQRGIGARLYRGGRYSPVHERGVHQFHRLIAAALSNGGAGAAAGTEDNA
jgi:choline monooxygenase